MQDKKIESALLSVYTKDGLEPIVRALDSQGVRIFSTGGTQRFIEKLGVEVTAVEDLTSYPSILDGRVKTLHPKVFGGLLARREEGHLRQLEQYEIPEIDLVIVDLYPFEDTVASTDEESAIIEKIDIGGIALIRAAAKNFRDVAVVPSRDDYGHFLQLFQEGKGCLSLEQRRGLARRAFAVSSHYDTAIFTYFDSQVDAEIEPMFKRSIPQATILRYGENPHQQGVFYGALDELFDQVNGKPLSYNNLVDIDAAVGIMHEFRESDPTFAILKHTNPCGVATRGSVLQAWRDALAGDPQSAFGGILISNRTLDRETAEAIDEIFYEVLIAPDYTEEALELLCRRKKRIVLRMKSYPDSTRSFRSLLNGVVEQDIDRRLETANEVEVATARPPSAAEMRDMLFANACVKHLKSNAIAIVKGEQLIGAGCGQTSRVDALRQAIEKAQRFGFDLQGAVMASDAFFPFADSVEMAQQAGVGAVIQPGGSIRDKDSIAYCDDHGMAMVLTGVRHFRH